MAGAVALLADTLVLDDRAHDLGQRGEDLDRRADQRIRTFVLETIPAVLADRARLEHTAGDRPGMAGPREESEYAAWRQRANPVIRTGTAFLDSRRMAALLDAVPGRRAGITNAVALLADTLVLDDRAQAFGRHGEDLDRSAGRRIRTFVLETIPAVLADRARLGHTAGGRPGMAGIQEESEYAAWRQRAGSVIRIGTALLASRIMAPLLAAAPGRRDALDSTTAYLRDTLDLDDRAQTLARHGVNLDRRTDRRVRTFVLEAMPAVLADRVRLERTAGDRPGMVGIQEEPDYAAWRQRANPVIRTGTALLASRIMAPLLAAAPGRRDVLDSTTAYLRDTLDLDDRAHTRLLYDRDAIYPTGAAGAGSPPTTRAAPARPDRAPRARGDGGTPAVLPARPAGS